MGHSKNKVGVIQFTILTIVSMTDGIIMIPTLAAGVGAISLICMDYHDTGGGDSGVCVCQMRTIQ